MDQMVRRQTPEGPPRRAGGSEAAGRSGGSGAVGRPGGAPRRRGRALENAIFDATLDLLISGGFARLTMEGVAGAAQTGKAALYRRWASKADLVISALGATLPPPTDIPDLGSVRAELLQLMAGFGAVMNSRAGAAIRVVMSELDHEQALVFKDFLVARVVAPSNAAMIRVLARGERRGDVRAGAAVPIVADIAPAMLMYHSKICEGPLDERFCLDLVDQVLVPLVRP
ncbi:TetR/AcrR family transcriptional regulator [Kitasatospora paranensis]|uniref:TetR/AcrR family transcriptional regulator n=1 Tax=Kitasatospora paranensis TaxID=258053 RepID=A0ABW2G1Q1_9ACTN